MPRPSSRSSAIAHIALRIRLPQADPYLLPLVGILASLGLCEIYRIRPALARDQALWMAIGVARVRGGARAAPRLPRARALPLPERRAGRSACSRSRSLLVRDPHGDQRRARLDPRRRPLVPAGRARQDLPRPLPRRLPARAPRAAGADADPHPRRRPAAAAAARPAARHARCRAAAARRDERLRHVAALLRRVRRARVRRDRPHRLRRDRPRRVRRRQRDRLHDRAAGRRARLDLARPLEDVADERLPDRAVALHGRGRRPLRLGARTRLHPDGVGSAR